jgi:hypothetical protein
MTGRIPSRIIQTGKSAALGLREQACVAGLRALNPDFEYLFFDDAAVERFIRDEFPEYQVIFGKFAYRIQRYDFFRYLAVYRLGGFYFDLDVFLAKSLEALRQHSCVFPFEEVSINPYLREKRGMDWEIGNYAFGAAAGHPFLKAVVTNCVRSVEEPDWAEVMMNDLPWFFRSESEVLNTTGPGVLSRTFAENLELRSEVTILFPDDICDQTHWHQFGDYGVHMMDASWRAKGSFWRRRLSNLWQAKTYQNAIKDSRKMGGKRRFCEISTNLVQTERR